MQLNFHGSNVCYVVILLEPVITGYPRFHNGYGCLAVFLKEVMIGSNGVSLYFIAVVNSCFSNGQIQRSSNQFT